MWNLEGMFVSAKYMGEFDVRGKVSLSRVKFGGEVSHHIELEQPINVYGRIRNAGENVIISNHEIYQISSN